MNGLCIGMPWSNAIMSVGSIWILFVWLIEMLSRKFRANQGEDVSWPKRNKWVFWGLFSLTLLHVVGLIHTHDFTYGLDDLRKKLPLLLFPVVCYSMLSLPSAMWLWLKRFFVASLFLAVLACFFIRWAWWEQAHFDVRQLSVFTSHIRFSLMLNLGLVILFKEALQRSFSKILALVFGLVYILFMWEVQSITGLGLLGVLVMYAAWTSLKAKGLKATRGALIVLGFLGLITSAVFIGSAIHEHYYSGSSEFQGGKTSEGNDFECELNKRYRESGALVYCNFNRYEMSLAWNERSKVLFTGKTKTGGLISATLMRYMTSIGVTKDYQGVLSLSDEDIAAVEQGITNPKLLKRSALHQRIDQLFFEIDALNSGDDPSGKSFIQRIEYWKTATHIIQKHPFIGVGTGDVQAAFNQQYEEDQSALSERFRLRSHQQFLTFWVAFGVFGPLLLLLAIYLCYRYRKAENSFIALGFLLIVSLSFLSEDTLETQAGVTFFSFFISFLFLWPIASLSASEKPHQA